MPLRVCLGLWLLLLVPSWVWSQALSRREAALLNPLEYGSSCTTATLSAAISAAPATGRVLMLTPVQRDGTPCVWAITSNVSVPSHLVLHVPQGASVAISSGAFLTLARYPREDNRAWKTGAGTLIITEANPTTGAFSVKDFGAIGNGVADDRASIQATLNTAATGSKIVHFPSGTYYLGSFSAYTRILDLSGMGDNVTLQTEKNVKFTTNTTTDVNPVIFYVQNNNHLRVGPMRFEDFGYLSTVPLRGVKAFQIFNDGGNYGDLVFEALYATRIVAVVSVESGPVPSATNRIRGIHIGQLVAEDCFYGVTAANEGDGLTIDNLYADLTWRSFFVYGVSDHRAKVFSRRPKASSGNVVISNGLGGPKTAGIEVTYTSREADNSTNYTHVLFSHQDLAGGEISGIRVHVDIKDTGANSYYPVRFVNYSGTTEITTPTANIVKDIWLSGSATTQALPVFSNAAYAIRGLLHFEPGFFFRYEPSILTTFVLNQSSRSATAMTWASSGTQPSIGDGSLTYALDLVSGMAHVSIKQVMGSTTTFGTGFWIWGAIDILGYPLTPTATTLGTILMLDASGLWYTGVARMVAGSATITGYAHATNAEIGPTMPFTWQSGDEIYITIVFPIY